METSIAMAKPTESGLVSVRARARANRQTQVKLQRTQAADEVRVRSSLQKIRTLKNKSADGRPPENTGEPNFFGMLWGKFQELIGNR